MAVGFIFNQAKVKYLKYSRSSVIRRLIILSFKATLEIQKYGDKV